MTQLRRMFSRKRDPIAALAGQPATTCRAKIDDTLASRLLEVAYQRSAGKPSLLADGARARGDLSVAAFKYQPASTPRRHGVPFGI